MSKGLMYRVKSTVSFGSRPCLPALRNYNGAQTTSFKGCRARRFLTDSAADRTGAVFINKPYPTRRFGPPSSFGSYRHLVTIAHVFSRRSRLRDTHEPAVPGHYTVKRWFRCGIRFRIVRPVFARRSTTLQCDQQSTDDSTTKRTEPSQFITFITRSWAKQTCIP